VDYSPLFTCNVNSGAPTEEEEEEDDDDEMEGEGG